MAEDRLKTVVILGSVREGRLGSRAAKFILNILKERGWESMFIDPKEYDLPILRKRFKDFEPGKAPENLKKLSEIFKAADAFILISAEYNHSIPPALSNILDYFHEEYFWRPSAIVSYSSGGFGGVRAAVHLRDMVSELGMPSIPTNFAISRIQDSLDENGNALDEGLNRRIKKFFDELEWYARALKEQRKKGVPY